MIRVRHAQPKTLLWSHAAEYNSPVRIRHGVSKALSFEAERLDANSCTGDVLTIVTSNVSQHAPTGTQLEHTTRRARKSRASSIPGNIDREDRLQIARGKMGDAVRIGNDFAALR
ncbi:MAG: hypothetical protein AAF488_19380, partial [Planctomycetota bacterium]